MWRGSRTLFQHSALLAGVGGHQQPRERSADSPAVRGGGRGVRGPRCSLPAAPPSPCPPRRGRPAADGGREDGRGRSGSRRAPGGRCGSMAPAGRLCCAALLCGALSLCSLRAAPRQPDTLYMWIDAQQARVLIGFEEDILIVSEGKMAPFTHDFRKAQQRMPAIPVGIHAMNFTWQATGRRAGTALGAGRRAPRRPRWASPPSQRGAGARAGSGSSEKPTGWLGKCAGYGVVRCVGEPGVSGPGEPAGW
ncbi:uncharacterized protein LOC113984904 [Pipra filicauda]|uniref:Uncharacterized protein LOC113984904 n=1 Tax=Pipra filicauda TaxID=649802 RepID=A0A6J2G7L9_9PASS|nr:uncharacterized protein LOC113984904 [Pipra filicauda]